MEGMPLQINTALTGFRTELEAAAAADPAEDAIAAIVTAAAGTWALPASVGARCRAEAHRAFWVASARLQGQDVWVLQCEKRLRTRPGVPRQRIRR